MIEELYLFYEYKKSNRKNLRPNLNVFCERKMLCGLEGRIHGC